MARADDTFSPQNMRGYRLTILTQLRQVIENTHSTEQMFQWLSSVVTQSFDVSIAQFWTCENAWPGSPSAQLRAMAYRDPSQPVHLIGEKVAPAVEQIARGAHTPFVQPVEQVFPSYLASLLKRYGLPFCACCFNVHPLARQAPAPGQPAELIFLALLFLAHSPQRELVSTMTIILEQAIAVAEGHGLVLAGASSSDREAPAREAISQGIPPALAGLIPHKKQDARLMLSSNPFASPVAISDKQVQRLYEAVDGHKTFAQLCNDTTMTLQEAYKALRTLLSLHYIDLYTPQGAPVDEL